jgi:hypothetical protein
MNFTAPCNHPVTVEHINIRNIKTDAGTQFTLSNLSEACATTSKKLLNKAGEPDIPYELFYEKKHMAKHFRISGCPYVAKKYTIIHPRGNVTVNTRSQKGVIGIFIGPPPSGRLVVFLPQSSRLAVSQYCQFDETLI